MLRVVLLTSMHYFTRLVILHRLGMFGPWILYELACVPHGPTLKHKQAQN